MGTPKEDSRKYESFIHKDFRNIAKNADYERRLSDEAKTIYAPAKTPSLESFVRLEEYKSASEQERTRIRENEEDKREQSDMRNQIAEIKRSQKNTIRYSMKSERIFLWLSEKKKISFSRNPFFYLRKIIRADRVSVNDLVKVGTTDKYSNISTTIKKINEKFKKVLPSEKLIENSRDGSGYTLNKNIRLLSEE